MQLRYYIIVNVLENGLVTSEGLEPPDLFLAE